LAVISIQTGLQLEKRLILTFTYLFIYANFPIKFGGIKLLHPHCTGGHDDGIYCAKALNFPAD